MGSVHLLAAQAARLNREAGNPAIPSLFFFTDPERTPDPTPIALRLPRGTAIVYRHFGADDRVRVSRRLATIARSRGLALLIAADPELAQRVGAHGVHWPEQRLPPLLPPGLSTVAAHSAKAVAKAAAAGASACMLSPVFATRSAGSGPSLGLFRASQIARGAALPVIALGGISSANARLLAGRGFAGVGAVDAFLD